jgi:hypothetical protein
MSLISSNSTRGATSLAWMTANENFGRSLIKIRGRAGRHAESKLGNEFQISGRRNPLHDLQIESSERRHLGRRINKSL